MKRHPYSAVFPDMQPEEYDALKTSIQDNGYDESFPIWIYEGQVLDGWHRYRACRDLKLPPPPAEQYTGDDPLMFAIRANGQRRNLTIPQRACVALNVLPYFEAEAKKRQLSSLKQNAPLGAGAPNGKGKARDQIGDLIGVSGDSVQRMKRIAKEAPDVFERFLRGDNGLSIEKEFKRLIEAEAERKEADRRRAEAEAQAKADAARRASAEAERARRVAAEAMQRQKEEARQKREAAERERQAAERAKTEAARRAAEEKAARLRAEAEKAERARKAAEEDERKKTEAAARKKQEAEEAARRARESEAARQKRAQEEEAQKWARLEKELDDHVTQLSSRASRVNSIIGMYREAGKLRDIVGYLRSFVEAAELLNALAGSPAQKIEREIIDV